MLIFVFVHITCVKDFLGAGLNTHKIRFSNLKALFIRAGRSSVQLLWHMIRSDKRYRQTVNLEENCIDHCKHLAQIGCDQTVL